MQISFFLLQFKVHAVQNKLSLAVKFHKAKRRTCWRLAADRRPGARASKKGRLFEEDP